MKTLEQACVPRASVFEQRGMDTVYNLDDLERIEPKQFFAENYVTDGMQLLLTEAFKRLEGKSESAAGTFLLSQSMGGGKTHNLVALGLLAQNPQLRTPVMGGFYEPGPLGAVRVVKFTGRKTHTPFGLWGEIAEQLNKKDAFKDFYSPLQPPGTEQWVELLRGDPLLIMLDELPPYFEAAKGVAVGATHLHALTTTALANLLVAVNGTKLPNVCVVITDLGGAAYSSGSASVNEALMDLEKEVSRSVVRIDPVLMNSNELYHILQTRLFETTPDETAVGEVADAYRAELESARLMDMTTLSADQIRADIATAYPFHPAIRDLYARFKENQGFQQTRALIRLMRLVVADLWESGAARSKHLIGAHDFDLHAPQVLSELRQINPSLENAVAHDIAAEGGSSVAEQIDGGTSADAQDVARLVFLSSLSQAVSPTLGLDRSEIAAYLAAPGRDLNMLRQAVDRLQSEAWYIHPTRDGRLLFKNTENLVAKLDTYTRGQLREQRESELRQRLTQMFKTEKADCYQDVQPLPALDQVQLSPDKVTLVIFKPGDAALTDITEFYEHQLNKNRAVFLTGPAAAYETVLHRAAEVAASRKIIQEMDEAGRRADDPQLIEAEGIKSKKEAQFYQACRETFQTLYYPSKNGLTALELELKYEANEYHGEQQVALALKDAYKFRNDTGADTSFRTVLENKLWPAQLKEVAWSTIRQRAAQDPSWLFHHPRALDDLRDELVRRDIWREHGGYIERGPFPKPAASVQVQLLKRDEATGDALLRVRPLHGDRVYWSEQGPPTPASEQLDVARDLSTKAARVWFLAVDSTGEHEAGEPFEWHNEITVKHRLFQDGDLRRCELKAYPAGEIRFTTDGSNPELQGDIYSEPFPVPDGSRFIQAVAEAQGIRSLVAKFDVPKDGQPPVTVDAKLVTLWLHRHVLDDTNAVFSWLELAQRHQAELGGVDLTVARGFDWVQYTTSKSMLRAAEAVMEAASEMKELLPEGNVNLNVEVLRFETGQGLLDFVAGLKTELAAGEVDQS
jgi:hypothetical protein